MRPARHVARAVGTGPRGVARQGRRARAARDGFTASPRTGPDWPRHSAYQ